MAIELPADVRHRVEEVLLSADPIDLGDIDPKMLVRARAAYFVLHRAPDIDVASFVDVVLPRILNQFSADSTRVRVTSRHRLRGRIDWSATQRTRSAAGFDPLVYETRVAQRTVDTPENQVVRFVFDRVRDALGSIPALLNDGVCRVSDDLGPDLSTRSQVGAIATQIQRLSRHRHLKLVPTPPQVDSEMLAAAEMSKNRDYGLVASLYRRWSSAVTHVDLDGFAACGRSTWVLPPRADDDGEPWIRVAAYHAGSRSTATGGRAQRVGW